MPSRRIDMEEVNRLEAESLKLGKGSILDQSLNENVYKYAKEQFVSNLNGGTFWEILLIISIFPITYFIFNLIYQYFIIIFFSSSSSSNNNDNDNDNDNDKNKNKNWMWRVGLEIIIIIIPNIIALCLFTYSWYIHIIIIIIELTIGYLVVRNVKQQKNISLISWNGSAVGCYQRHKIFISIFRSGLMLLTIISILGVDFVIFPRRFAKCETFGFSVMDVGIGLFVIAQGMVSPTVMQPSEISKIDQNQEYKKSSSPSSTIKSHFQVYIKMITRVLPLFILGMARLISTQSVGYQLHVSEYGVHWNFFFTMCLLSLLSALLHHWIIYPYQQRHINSYEKIYLIIGIGIAILYQVLLSSPLLANWNLLPSLEPHMTGIAHKHNKWSVSTLYGIHDLSDYILYYPRTNSSSLINLNREGIFSSIGFTSIYFIGCWLGVHLHRPRKSKKEIFSLMFWLFLSCLGLMGCLYFLHNWIQEVSRRLCNLTFVVWVTLVTNWVMSFSLLSSGLLCFEPQSLLVNAINYNQMGIFLFANILTGIINIKLKTLLATPMIAYMIVGCYVLICCVIFIGLERYQIRFKFW